MRKETITFEYNHCGECPHPVDFVGGDKLLKHRCGKDEEVRFLLNIWGGIPDWCPLEIKDEKQTAEE